MLSPLFTLPVVQMCVYCIPAGHIHCLASFHCGSIMVVGVFAFKLLPLLLLFYFSYYSIFFIIINLFIISIFFIILLFFIIITIAVIFTVLQLLLQFHLLPVYKILGWVFLFPCKGSSRNACAFHYTTFKTRLCQCFKMKHLTSGTKIFYFIFCVFFQFGIHNCNQLFLI